MWALRLITGRRVGMKLFGFVYAEAVERICVPGHQAGKVAIRLGRKTVKCALRRFIGARLDHNIQTRGLRRPDSKVNLPFARDLCADWIAARNR